MLIIRPSVKSTDINRIAEFRLSTVWNSLRPALHNKSPPIDHFEVEVKQYNVGDEQISRRCGVFYRAAAMQPRYCDEQLSVCLSARLSVKCVNCDKTKAPSEKSSIMTNRKSSTSFPMSLRWTAYVAPNPQREPQKRKKCVTFKMSSMTCAREMSTCDHFH